MKKHVLLAVTTLVIILSSLSNGLYNEEPDQIHLAFGDNEWDMVVTWSTIKDTDSSLVKYRIGRNSSLNVAVGSSRLFVNSGKAKRKQYIHRATLSRLTPGSKYFYLCGSPEGWSREYSFTTPASDPSWQPRVAVFGDLGYLNPQALHRLVEEVDATPPVDAVIHAGDFAYELGKFNGHLGDSFMDMIEPIAARVPYMTCPGNHEYFNNFNEYRNRFSMPGHSDSMFYSFNVGPIHFISISTEVYFFVQYGLKDIVEQFDWLRMDLKQATHPANRHLRPWIVVIGHRPMYCSNQDYECQHQYNRVRQGLPFLQTFGLEDLLDEYGVDLCIWGHQHCYERSWPLYDHRVYNGSEVEPYRNPGATVHITSGAPGNKHKFDLFLEVKPEWSAFRSLNYSYTMLQAFNSTHLYWEQVPAYKDMKVIDKVWLIKDQHTRYRPRKSRSSREQSEALAFRKFLSSQAYNLTQTLINSPEINNLFTHSNHQRNVHNLSPKEVEVVLKYYQHVYRWHVRKMKLEK